MESIRQVLINNMDNVRRQNHSEIGNLQVDSDLHRHEAFQKLELALSLLPPSHRRLLELRNAQKKSFSQIGDEIGKSADEARKLWVQGIDALRQIIQNLNQQPSDDS